MCKDDYVVERSELKEQKYLELRADLARRYQSKVINLAIAIGVTGVVSLKTREAVQKLNRFGIPLVLSKLQKAAATGSAIILRRVLAQKFPKQGRHSRGGSPLRPSLSKP